MAEEKERLGSEDAFWEEYSNAQGGRLGWQQILDRLQERRKKDAVRDAQAAREFFGGDLKHKDAGGIFCKPGTDDLYTKDATIAAKWRVLLETNEDVRAQWKHNFAG